MLYSVEMEKFTDSDSCSACSVEYYLYIFLFLSSDFESIDQSCQYYYSRTVLIIMHDRDIELRLQSLLDLETSWG